MPQMNYFMMVAQATLPVQIVLGLLVCMSLVSWSIIFIKFCSLGAAKRDTKRDMDSFQEAQGLHSAIEVMGRDLRSPAYRVAAEAVSELNRFDDIDTGNRDCFETVKENLRRALKRGVSKEIAQMSASLSFLATCANAAPFIGLFGTVWGIMHSFHTIGNMKAAALAQVAPGISEALIATAIGLAVAIPSTVAYNYFMGILAAIEADLVNFAGVFLNRVQRELPKIVQD
ncbi:biopolymer transport protein ExbB [Desulfovibrionales bacterium]